MQLKKIEHSELVLTYFTNGYSSGQRHVLICFHGYGQTGKNFHFLETALGSTCKIIAINWFGSFESNFPEKSLSKTALSNLIELILQKEQAQKLPVSFVSFSIGVIPLLAVVETNLLNINKLIIIGAPGFSFFRFLRFAVTTTVGKYLFSLVVAKYQFFNRFINSGAGKLIFGSAKVKLISNYLSDADKLIFVQKSWQSLAELTITRKELKKMSLSNCTYICGENDLITPSKGLRKFLTMQGATYIETLNGHKLNTTENIKLLSKMFY